MSSFVSGRAPQLPSEQVFTYSWGQSHVFMRINPKLACRLAGADCIFYLVRKSWRICPRKEIIKGGEDSLSELHSLTMGNFSNFAWFFFFLFSIKRRNRLWAEHRVLWKKLIVFLRVKRSLVQYFIHGTQYYSLTLCLLVKTAFSK